MFRKAKLPSWIGIFLLFIAFYLGITQLLGNKSSTMSKNIVNIETETEETDEYTSFITVPSFNNDEINKPIHQWIRKQEEEFLDSVAVNQEEMSANFRSHLNIKVDIEAATDHLYNVIIESQQYTGGANGHIMVKAFTVDVSEPKILTINKFFRADDKNLAFLHTLVKEKLNNDQETEMYVFDEALGDAFYHWDSLKWSINLKSLSLYFDKYEVSAGAAGPIQIDLPLDEISTLLTKDSAKMLQVYEEDEPSGATNTAEEQVTQNPIIDHNENNSLDESIDPNGKYVALTFDDGPSGEVTPRILATLKESNTKATFFMLGSQVNHYPEVAKQVADEGHEIANHTVNHLDLTILSEIEAREEVAESRRMIREATGYDPIYVRTPYGAYNDTIINQAQRSGESIILWSVDSLDWKYRDAESVRNIVLDNVTSGSIVLMHDIHATTADALPSLIQALKAEGYQLVTISQFLELRDAQGVGPFFGKYK